MTPAALARRAAADPAPADLLRRFAADRDGEAFAGLVRQFGPVVLGTCRRVLGPSADADDAFQAVFVALARQAGRFRDAQSLPAWLHRVSLRTARRLAARRSAGTRGLTPAGSPDPVDPADPFADVAWRDVRRVLDEELDRLPAQCRGPVVLCLLDGLTRDEAAARLGVSLNTVKRRLDAGRELLRARLVRRGVAPVAVAGAALDPAGLRATVPPTLVAAVTATARTVAPAAGLRWAVVAAAGLVAAGVGWAVAPAPAPLPEAVAIAPPAQEAPVPEPTPVPKGVTAVYGSLRFRVPDDGISAAAVSPDGKLIAVAVHTGVRVYAGADWKPVWWFPAADTRGVWTYGGNLAFSPDGRLLGYTRNDRDAYVWDVATGKRLNRFDGGDIEGDWRWSWFCAFDPDGRFVLSDPNRLYFYDPATGREVRSVPTGGRALALSPDARHYVRWRGKQDPEAVVLCDARTGKALHTFDVFLRQTNGVAFSPDGKTMTLAPAHVKELQLWDIETRTKVAALPTGIEGDADRLPSPLAGFTPDGKTIWMGLPGGDVLRWDAATRKELPRLKASGGPPPRWVLPVGDGATLLTPTGYGWVRVWDAATGKERPILGRYGFHSVFALSPDGKLVAAGDGSGRTDLLDAATGKLVRTLRETGDRADRFRFSPDGRRLAVDERKRLPNGTEAEAARVLNVADGAEVRAFGPDPDDDRFQNVRIAGFVGPDGSQVLLADRYSHARVVDLATGDEVRRIKTRTAEAVSPDGRTLAAEVHGEIVFSDLTTGKVVRRVMVDPEEKKNRRLIGGTPVAWSADGKTVAVGLWGDNIDLGRPKSRETVVLLDPATGAERARFVVNPRPPDRTQQTLTVSALAVSPDGARVAAAVAMENGQFVGVWDAAAGRLVAELPHPFQVWGAAFAPDGKSVLTFGFNGVGYRWDLDAVLAPGKK